MIPQETLRQVVLRQKAGLSLPPGTVPREITDDILTWFDDKRILILTGVRRCGKSTLLKQIMQKKTGWCYVNFEDERLLDFRAEEFERLNEALIGAYGPSRTYFFDEIQNIEKFETFVRRLHEEGKKILITGSNAALLSTELGTRLTGRYKAFSVYPFSFAEFLAFKNVALRKDAFHVTETKVRLLTLFQEYLAQGGLPEYLQNRDKEYVKTIYENILYRDIITRYSIRNEKILKELVNFLTTNSASLFTYNSLKNSLGLANAITVKEYISYLQNAFLFFELLKFSHSVKRQLGSPRKIFLIDNAFHHVCGLNFTPNKGRNLENAVFLELRRRGKEVFYFADKGECDFAVKEGTKITEAIQACYALENDNREREIAGLLDAMDFFKLKTGRIITFEQTEELVRRGRKIGVVPAARWMLEGR